MGDNKVKISDTESDDDAVIAFTVNQQQMQFLRRVCDAEQIPFDMPALTKRSLMEFFEELQKAEAQGKNS